MTKKFISCVYMCLSFYYYSPDFIYCTEGKKFAVFWLALDLLQLLFLLLN